MITGSGPAGLELSEEEAYGLLAMCLTSPQGIDGASETAIRKLAAYCIELSNHSTSVGILSGTAAEVELERAGT